MSVNLVYCSKAARELALVREVEWMGAALKAPGLNQLRFKALMELIHGWADEQIMALAAALRPDQACKGRTEALNAIGAMHDRRTRLILELDTATSAFA